MVQVLYKGRKRLVHIGKSGGRYVIVEGNKRYLKPKTKPAKAKTTKAKQAKKKTTKAKPAKRKPGKRKTQKPKTYMNYFKMTGGAKRPIPYLPGYVLHTGTKYDDLLHVETGNRISLTLSLLDRDESFKPKVFNDENYDPGTNTNTKCKLLLKKGQNGLLTGIDDTDKAINSSLGFIILYGVAMHYLQYPGSLSLDGSELYRILHDIMRSPHDTVVKFTNETPEEEETKLRVIENYAIFVRNTIKTNQNRQNLEANVRKLQRQQFFNN
tara:strand:+ start:186 stop:989 length:804 start_codon:yes stop_codon:yes gene_type:complete